MTWVFVRQTLISGHRKFATGQNKRLVNNKEYYFIAVAYAHNRYKEYSQTDASKLDGQKSPYLAGRQNEWKQEIPSVKAIPHNPTSENGGTIIQANYGDCPVITRIEGNGNGGMILRLTEKSIEELMGAPGEEGHRPASPASSRRSSRRQCRRRILLSFFLTSYDLAPPFPNPPIGNVALGPPGITICSNCSSYLLMLS